MEWKGSLLWQCVGGEKGGRKERGGGVEWGCGWGGGGAGAGAGGKEKKGCGGIQGGEGGDGDKWLHGTTSVPLATVNFGLKASG